MICFSSLKTHHKPYNTHTKKYHWWQTLEEETHDLYQVDVSLEPYHFTMLQPIAGGRVILDWVAQHPVGNHAPLHTNLPIFVKPFFFQSCCVPDHSPRPWVLHRVYKQHHMSSNIGSQHGPEGS